MGIPRLPEVVNTERLGKDAYRSKFNKLRKLRYLRELFFLGLKTTVVTTLSVTVKSEIIMEGIIVVFFFMVIKEVSSTIIICEESQSSNGLLRFLGFDTFSIQVFGFGFIVMSFICYNFFTNAQRPSVKVDSEPRKKGSGKAATLSECFEGIASGHIVFEQNGVEVFTINDMTTVQQDLPSDLNVLAESPSKSEILAEDELLLSPTIKLMGTRMQPNGKLGVHIPHVANMILSSPKWNIILKELGQNGKWKAIKQSDNNGISKFVSESNHVKLFTDHLSTFVIVGKYDRTSLSMFKRMKIAAFCGEPQGDGLAIMLYIFDDCEWSYETLISREKRKVED
ncbi:PREDICTED: uncharacterized protein LOC107350643 isoform X1 [Acropora digitifera]|uniref:uncharacterized protein LOC107350643 isoform X1 n=1 Tax=Acropora digitifera TaxID=70779 RepID=UPI00077A21C0|nr:PREDICTED: uncharacterized protein LOC107350643 isoform X1 [Acropora digitifera]